MKFSFPRTPRTREKGAAGIEAALIIAFILLPLLTSVFFVSKFFWHYTVVQKAVHDATLYMASAPLSELRNGSVRTIAGDIITRELSDLGSATTLEPQYYCGFRLAGNSSNLEFRTCDDPDAMPVAVKISAKMTVSHPFFDGGSRIVIYIPVEMRHVGL